MIYTVLLLCTVIVKFYLLLATEICKEVSEVIFNASKSSDAISEVTSFGSGEECNLTITELPPGALFQLKVNQSFDISDTTGCTNASLSVMSDKGHPEVKFCGVLEVGDLIYAAYLPEANTTLTIRTRTVEGQSVNLNISYTGEQYVLYCRMVYHEENE